MPERIPDARDDEISLLDVLLVIAENWIVLVVVPLVLGTITFGIVSLQAKTFRSEAVVRLSPVTVIGFVEAGLSEGTLDPVLTLIDEGGAGLTVSEGPDAQSSQITLVHVDRGAISELDRLVAALVVAARGDPLVSPTGELAARIERVEDRLGLTDTIVARLETAIATLSDATPFDAEAYASSVLALDQMLARRTLEEAELNGLQTKRGEAVATDIVITPPAGPLTEGRSPMLLAALVVLGAGFLILVLVFIRAGLKGAWRDPETRAKLDRIKNAFLLRKANL